MFQAKIQALKKLASKGDKKKKKDTNDEITKLESDLVSKHNQVKQCFTRHSVEDIEPRSMIIDPKKYSFAQIMN